MTPTMTRNQRAQAGDHPFLSPSTRTAPHGSGGTLSRLLGYFSIGLGLAEVLAPRAMAQLTGVDRQGMLRAYGLREIISGIGILSNTRPAGWLWSRVAGDALDLLTLSNSFSMADAQKRKRALASFLAVAGVTALDMFCANCPSMRRTDG